MEVWTTTAAASCFVLLLDFVPLVMEERKERTKKCRLLRRSSSFGQKMKGWIQRKFVCTSSISFVTPTSPTQLSTRSSIAAANAKSSTFCIYPTFVREGAKVKVWNFFLCLLTFCTLLPHQHHHHSFTTEEYSLRTVCGGFYTLHLRRVVERGEKLISGGEL